MNVLKNRLPKAAFLLASLLLLNFSVTAKAVPVKESAGTEHCKLIKSGVLESKGIIEPVIELVNGNNFQQNSTFFKKNTGSQVNIGLEAAFIAHAHAVTADFYHVRPVPLYLFNRSILI